MNSKERKDNENSTKKPPNQQKKKKQMRKNPKRKNVQRKKLQKSHELYIYANKLDSLRDFTYIQKLKTNIFLVY